VAGSQKKARREGRLIAFIDETGVSTRPHRVRTWAPRGKTPVIRETFGWKSLSIIGAISLWRILFRIHPGAIKGPQVVDFLKVLARHTRQPLMVIWDGAPIHRSRLVTDYIASTGGKIVVERLPAYAPELNPAEYIWAHLKQHEIGNLLVKEAWQLSHHATAALRKMRGKPRIIRACFVQANLWPE
jgi:transposase